MDLSVKNGVWRRKNRGTLSANPKKTRTRRKAPKKKRIDGNDGIVKDVGIRN